MPDPYPFNAEQLRGTVQAGWFFVGGLRIGPTATSKASIQGNGNGRQVLELLDLEIPRRQCRGNKTRERWVPGDGQAPTPALRICRRSGAYAARKVG